MVECTCYEDRRYVPRSLEFVISLRAMRARNNSREDQAPLYEYSCSDEEDKALSLEHGPAPPGGDKITFPPHIINKSSSSTAIPGRPKRRNKTTTDANVIRKRRSSKSSWQRLWLKWKHSGYGTLLLAVILWYTLGVISISTSKLLLTPSKHHANSPRYYFHVGGVPPLILTMQQLLLGSSLLRFLLSIHFLNSPGLQPWESLGAFTSASPGSRYRRHGQTIGQR
jgi:hypothetical protein